jgi:hypothetical protein
MGLRALSSETIELGMEFWWILGMIFLGSFVLTILNRNLISQETTIIHVQTPRMTVSESPYSIVVNITHRMPEIQLPPASAAITETKKML